MKNSDFLSTAAEMSTQPGTSNAQFLYHTIRSIRDRSDHSSWGSPSELTALIAGFIGGVAAGGLFIIVTGVMITHLPQGWFMNWFGKKGGEGIEYFVVLLTMLLVVVIRGSGALAADRLL
jgi:hypothetical protein